MSELLALKFAFIAVMGGAAAVLARGARRSVRLGGDWWTGWLLAWLVGALAASEAVRAVGLAVRH